ncbi:DNA cytosine methyltransferase [Kitasatospora xanthocidica]|uniref:DNA (cytosine-5-)-methyltransferase n=1 Tax=Kitasatospora xanthocidica TaxID=83382 RepID=A0A372ZVH5_9ACTN|nr:DNA cytosine methyltransferase [Kitasatospora xanthocidica]RGD59390.1 DNA cytosine methyltransferase [Kitasatospora xanthocidica]
MSVTFTDFLCGAGGSSTGLVESGLELKLAVNHWDVALETHAANHTRADHLCIDVSGMPMRYLPKSDVLWASVICTEISPAGGNTRETPQLDLLDGEDGFKTLPVAAFERTRVTAWCVVRATEVHRYKAIVVENVVEFARDWLLFPQWIAAMTKLGYNYQVTSVSSAHIGDETNVRAPQWRDRVYVTFTRRGMRKPNLTPSPPAWCFECGEQVNAIQSWHDPNITVGKYGQQYSYVCPNARCGHTKVEPWVRPASAAIDWTDLGRLIGTRRKPLATTTMNRIRIGLAKYPYEPHSITINHGQDGGDRAYALAQRPMPVRSTKQSEAMIVPAGGSWNTEPYPATRPLRTRTTSESEALFTAPPFIVEYRNNATASSVHAPVASVTAQGNHHGLVMPNGRVDPRDRNTLVIPYRKSTAKHAGMPFHTLSTKDSAAIVVSAEDIDNCRFRMLKPREQLAAQRFPDSYIVLGTPTEQTIQAGNAVSCNVAHWIGRQLLDVL